MSPGSSGEWDSQYVSLSSVLYDSTENKYLMWYRGQAPDGSGGIGYAESLGSETGIAQMSVADVTLYPNPARGYLNIHRQNRNQYSLEIRSLSGWLLVQENHEGNDLKFDLSTFTSGVYIVTIRSAGQLSTNKLVKL